MANGVTAGETNGREVRWRLKRVEARLDAIEELKPELMAYELQQMNKKVDRLMAVVIKVGVSIVGSAIVFAFTVFALVGGPSS